MNNKQRDIFYNAYYFSIIAFICIFEFNKHIGFNKTFLVLTACVLGSVLCILMMFLLVVVILASDDETIENKK